MQSDAREDVLAYAVLACSWLLVVLVVVAVAQRRFAPAPRPRAGCCARPTSGSRCGSAIKAAGLAPLRPHDLRHTAVALWIAAGANPKEVSVRAGHTSVSFTLDRYGHLFPGHDTELRDRLDAMHAEGLQSQVT